MYRDNAMPAPVVLRELTVITRRGYRLAALLAGIALVLFSGGVAAAFLTDRAELHPLGWGLIGAGVVAVVAWVLHNRRRRRRLTLTRIGDRELLAIVDDNVELELPVRCSGVQVVTDPRGAPSYTVFLKVIDAKERGVLFQEKRRAIDGPVTGWFPVSEQSGPVPMFETTKANMIVELRDMLTAHANR